MIFRAWEQEDILPISRLEAACFSSPWSLKMFSDAYLSPHFYGVLAEDEGKIVGYACGTALFETAETDIVAVDGAYRRKGIGARLLTELELLAKQRGAERMLLEVRVSNTAAKTLYEKQGYEWLYTRSRYYPDGEDALVMQKTL